MAVFKGFQGVRYRLQSPEDAESRICPPYDVIHPAMADQLRERSPHNVIRLELPEVPQPETESDNRYTRAAALFRAWREEGVLAAEEAPALYVYGQRYEVEGKPQERLGLMGALGVEPYTSGVVLPHEQTFPKHKEDRFRLITTAQAQFSPIFGLYSAPDAGVRARLEALAAAPPVAVARDHEGVEHRLWAVTDPAVLAWAAGVFAGRQVFIADGHHRYETAIRFQQHCRAQHPDAPESWFDFVMTFLVEMDDPGLVLLPTHRLMHGPLPTAAELIPALEPYFQVESIHPDEVDQLAHHQLGILLQDHAPLRLTLRDATVMDRLDQEHCPAWRDMDVAILHRLLFQEILGLQREASYTRDPHEARAAVASGEYAAAFFLPRPSVDELKAVAGAGDRMPEKSTYFWPKAISGLVIHAAPLPD